MEKCVLSFLVATAIFLASSCDGARILALFPVGTKSHKIAAVPIFEALAKRGHSVTVVSAFKPAKHVENIEEIYLEGIASLLDKNYIDWFAMQQQNSLIQLSSLIYSVQDTFRASYLDLMDNRQVLDIIIERKVDLIIADGFFNEMVFPIIDNLKVPFVLHCSSAGLASLFTTMGANMEYASVPAGLTDYDDQMTFFERLNNLISTEIFGLVHKYFLVGILEEMAKKDFPSVRPFADIVRDASLIIVNSHPTTAWPRALPPAIIPAGNLHITPAKPLSEPFRSIADGATDGFVVFTLGSLVQVSSMPNDTVQTFVRVFSKLPQKVLWKWEAAELPAAIPPNVFLSKWLPQQDLLGHPNARLFITHGGLLGIQETIYHAVPVLGLPFGNDQRCNMAKAVKEGYGLRLDWDKVDDGVLFDAISRLINQPEFKANVTRVSQLVHDELVPSVDVAAYWIEHVLRHGGTKHLQLASKNVPFYQRYFLDAILFVVFVGFNTLLLIYSVAYSIVKSFRTSRTNGHNGKQKLQ